VGAGGFSTSGPNGYSNTILSSGSSNYNYGVVTVRDESDITKAGITFDNESGQSIVFGDVKSFRTEHPYRQEMDIWYAGIEGPEAAAYVRGTAHLKDGRAVVYLPDHFQVVASAGVTAQLTPLSSESAGLTLEERSPESIVVREMSGGKGTYDFDFLVMAVRCRHENYEVVREKEASSGLEHVELPRCQVSDYSRKSQSGSAESGLSPTVGTERRFQERTVEGD